MKNSQGEVGMFPTIHHFLPFHLASKRGFGGSKIIRMEVFVLAPLVKAASLPENAALWLCNTYSCTR